MTTDQSVAARFEIGSASPDAGRIFALARRLVGADEMFAFAAAPSAPPVSLGSAGLAPDAHLRAARYVEEYHRLDPMLRSRKKSPSGGAPSIIASEEIPAPDYRRFCFETPGLRQKIAFRCDAGDMRVYCNFYFSEPVRTQMIRYLGDLAEFVLPALTEAARRVAHPRAGFVARCEARLASVAPDLTLRERQVCARTIVGRTARAIAEELGVGIGSVLTYRRRAYARYGVSSAGALFERVGE